MWFIYRFLSQAQTSPPVEFINKLGISKTDFKNVEHFVSELKNQFEKITRSKYVYFFKIQNKQAPNSVHHLFFITKHNQTYGIAGVNTNELQF